MQLNQNNTPLVANQYTYDAMSRLATVSDGTNTAAYSRIAGTNLLNTTTITAGGSTKLSTTRNYDAQNRLTSISSTAGAVTKTYSYTYDDKDRRSRLDLADGSHWLYTYDAKGQIVSGAKYDSTNKAIPGQAFGYAYDDIGNLTTEQRGMTEMQYSYNSNPVNQYTQRLVPGIIPVTGQASVTSTVSVWLKNHGANAAAVTRPTRDGEYFKAAIPVNNTAANVTEALEITAVKFNTTLDKDVVKTINGSYTVPKTPQVFTYDDDGNMTGDGMWTYAWNGENRLIVAESADKKLEFAYDYKGRMIYRKAYTVSSGNWTLASTAKYVWDGFNQIAICNASDNLQKSMLWGEDINGGFQTAGGVGGLLAVNAPIASKTYLPCYDGNGNVMAYVDSADGSLAAEYEYSPSPVIISKNGPKADELAAIASFSTKPYDKDLDAFFYQFRILKYGRWMSRDLVGEKGGKNLYGFINNNPVSKWDYLGLKDMPHIRVAGGFTAGGLAGIGGPLVHFEAGSGLSIIFFPATCELAAFGLSAGIGKNLHEWRPITEADFENNHKDWLDFQGGLSAGLGVGVESAVYMGTGIADANSFEGIFSTAQGSVGIVTAGGYVATDGSWTGVTLTAGPGVGLIKIDWLYKHYGMVIDLDKDYGFPGRCACAYIRNKYFNISWGDAYRKYY